MNSSIRILHLEDDPADAELAQALLTSSGMTCQITRVQTRDEFDATLRRGGYDLILADFRLPMYDGMSALRLVRELGLDVPFIFVSGTMGEDAAVEGLTAGATDYVLKQKLSRLVPAVKRALREAKNQRERQQADRALKEQYSTLHSIIESANALVFSVDRQYRYTSFNRRHAVAMKALYGAEIETGHSLLDYMTVIEDQVTAKRNLDRAFAGEQLGEEVYSGEELRARQYFQVSYSPIKNETGEVIGGAVLAHDITERKRAERSIALLSFALNNVREAAFLIDEQAHLHFVNEESCRVLGYSRAELLSLSVPDIDPDFPFDRWRSHWSDLKTQHSLLFEGRHKAKDGHIFPVEINANYFEYDGQGYNLALVRDITERKRAEQERLAYLQFFESMDRVNRAIQGTRDLAQMMRDVLDTLLSIFDCDRAWLVYPCDPDAATWQVPMERTRPEYPGVLPIGVELPLDPVGAAVYRILREAAGPVQFNAASPHQVPGEMAQGFGVQSFMAMALYPKVGKPWSLGLHQCSYPRIWTPAEERLFQEIGRRLSDALTSLLIYRDLQESEERFSKAFRLSPMAISIIRVDDGRFVDANDVFVKLSGYAREEIIDHTATELLLYADPEIREPILQLLEEQSLLGSFEFKARKKSGEIIAGLAATVIIDLGGEKHYLSMIVDITDRKRAEEALWESSQMLQLVLDNMPAFVFWKDRNSVYLGCNDLFAANAGLNSPQEIVGLTDLDLPWKDAEAESYRADDRLVMETGLSKLNYEETQLTADGRVTAVRTSKVPLRNPAGDVIGVLGTFEDITDRKRAEARILRLNRLYATLSQINQTIVRGRDRGTLFHEICRVAVEHGQFRLAWISLIDEATDRVEPVAFVGEEQGFLTLIGITYRDEPLGHGPTGTAIREGRCVLCQDIATDPSMIPWRDQALRRGYRSSAAVPIRQHGRVIGALTVFTAESQGFDVEDEQLLDEIGVDISFALDALEQEAQRRQAESELNRLNAELEQRVIDRTAEVARAHERLRAILDTAGEGVVFTDLQGTIEYVNPAMERLTGYSAEEALGRNPRLWKSEQTPLATHQRLWNTLLRGEIWAGELINRRKDGTLYDAALTASPLTGPDGQIVGFVGVQRDITRQKELDRLKDQFVSNVSHELRTPLANILLHIGLLERGKPERRESYLHTLRREAERLRKMIEDLLDLSRLDRNVAAIQFQPTDLNQLLEPLVADRVALAEQRGLTLTYEPASELPLLLTDASKVTQVVSNLLTNALNYTPTGGSVRVWAAVRQHDGPPMAALTVRDTGQGISAQELPHLFERFYRGAAGRRASAPGTGLGLAISHEIVERLGGRITVESEVGHGAAFTVWLPVA